MVATINGEPNTQYSLDLKAEGGNGGKTPLKNLTINALTSANGKNNLIVELINLGFEREGDYLFKIYNGKQEVGSTLLRVKQAQGKFNANDGQLPN